MSRFYAKLLSTKFLIELIDVVSKWHLVTKII